MALGACAVLGGGVLLHSSPWRENDGIIYQAR
jgi:hypothetical protein